MLINKTQRCREYIQALEEERRKIQVFSRELPLCLELVTQAIDSYKQQLSGTTTEYNLNGQSECSEQTTSGGPVLEEFIPMKRAEVDEEEEEEDYEEQSHKSNHDDDDCVNNNEFNSNNNNSKKSDWLRSVQLWNQSPDPTPKEEESAKKVMVTVTEVKRNGSGGAFHLFKKEKSVGVATAAAAAASSSGDTGRSNGDGGSKKENNSQRKQRRCWSPELHRRFLQALQQLGGPHVATPKQIRDLMKVDGLTNDEVKSHLQKYRLHSRRPSPTNHNNSSSQQTAPQFVVVGGIWMPPPPEYASAMAAPSNNKSNKGIYAPVASLLSAFQDPSASNKKSCSHQNDGVHSNSNSPATSSSTHTTTASPAY